jgi:23S rRNA-/tRNA-specific pseudouridylate synthase
MRTNLVSLLGKGVKILKVDKNGLIALEKPTKLFSHPNKSADKNSCVINANYKLNEEKYVINNIDHAWLINRLDYASSGIILLSQNFSLVTVVKHLFKQREVKKKYFALVIGRMNKGNSNQSSTNNIWKNDISILKTNNAVRMHEIENQKENNKIAITKFKIINVFSNMTLLELYPLTGFTHQLRFQCATNGFPIVGDDIYGDFKFNKTIFKSVVTRKSLQRMYLHANNIDFDYILNGENENFTATSELPDEFNEIANHII